MFSKSRSLNKKCATNLNEVYSVYDLLGETNNMQMNDDEIDVLFTI